MLMNDIIGQRVSEVEKAYGKMMDLSKVAEYLGLDVNMVGALIQDGQLEAVNINGTYFVKPVQLVKFELDIKDMPVAPVGAKEVGIMNVTGGSIYSVDSRVNPLEMRFIITFDDGAKRKVKVRGKSEAEILQKKQFKIAEELEKYRNGLKGMGKSGNSDNVTRNSLKFHEVAEMWFEEFKRENESKGNSYSNVECRKYSLKTVNEAIGDMEIADIDREEAQEMINRISKDGDGKFRSRSYIMKAEGTFKLVMKYALEHGYTDKHIGKLNLNKNLVEPDKDSRFIDMEQLRKLLMCVEGNPFYNTLVNLMLSSGVRQEEALALDIDDVKKSIRDGVEMYQIYVGKAVVELSSNHYGVIDRLKHGEKARHIDITKDVYNMLVDYYNEDIKDEALMRKRREHGTERMIFVNQNGQAHNKRTLHHSLRNYLERNGMDGDKITLHMLRHTYASLMKNEIPLDRVSEILGHKDIAVTKRFYDTQTLEDHKRAGMAVEEMMRKIKG